MIVITTPTGQIGRQVLAFAGFTRPAAEAFNRHGVRRVVGVSMLGRGTGLPVTCDGRACCRQGRRPP